MLDEVARILRAYRELRDSRLNDVLEALFPPVSRALASAFGSSSYALGPAQYELRSADVPGARRVLRAATRAMVGSGGGEGGEGGAGAGEGAAGTAGAGGDDDGGGCRAALLQEPFEELVRRLAGRVAARVEAAARSKGGGSGGGIAAAGGGGSGGRGGGGGGFTEWGALLLRKEVRTLQQGLAALMETDSLNTQFDGLNELVSEGYRTCGGGMGVASSAISIEKRVFLRARLRPREPA